MGGQGSLDYSDYALRGGGGVSTKMIMDYMIISAQLIFKVARKNPFYNELDVAYNTLEFFNVCCPLIITHSSKQAVTIPGNVATLWTGNLH